MVMAMVNREMVTAKREMEMVTEMAMEMANQATATRCASLATAWRHRAPIV